MLKLSHFKIQLNQVKHSYNYSYYFWMVATTFTYYNPYFDLQILYSLPCVHQGSIECKKYELFVRVICTLKQSKWQGKKICNVCLQLLTKKRHKIMCSLLSFYELDNHLINMYFLKQAIVINKISIWHSIFKNMVIYPQLQNSMKCFFLRIIQNFQVP